MKTKNSTQLKTQLWEEIGVKKMYETKIEALKISADCACPYCESVNRVDVVVGEEEQDFSTVLLCDTCGRSYAVNIIPSIHIEVSIWIAPVEWKEQTE